MSYLAALKAAQAENSEKHALTPTAKTAKTRLGQFRQYSLEHVLPEFRDASAPEPPPEPDRHDRRCYLCASFTRSPYGFPLGLCQQHGDRIQHSTSQPTRFGCDNFMLRQPGDDSRICLACRHYSQQSTMCRVVNYRLSVPGDTAMHRRPLPAEGGAGMRAAPKPHPEPTPPPPAAGL